MDQVSVKYTIIFHRKTLQIYPNLDFGLKTNHLATLRTSQTKQVKPIL
jgi:hypothetical protein